MTTLLLDTCAMIFLSTGAKLRSGVEKVINDVLEGGGALAVSPYSAWEVGMQAAKGRFAISQRPESWFSAFMDRADVMLAPLTPSLLIASSFLPGGVPRDPADRIIAATAREYGFTLVTRDRALLDYAEAGHVNAVEC